jgi:ATP-dependent Clp protease ATP-binding subunit ClpB
MAERRIELQLSDEAADWLAKEGYDPSFGARPLKRLLQKTIADPLALQLLDGSFLEGDQVQVVVDGDSLAFRSG